MVETIMVLALVLWVKNWMTYSAFVWARDAVIFDREDCRQRLARCPDYFSVVFNLFLWTPRQHRNHITNCIERGLKAKP